MLAVAGLTHERMAKTHTPIYGVLSQPLTSEMKQKKCPTEGDICNESYGYIDASHVEFLETGGARVVPIDWRLNAQRMNKALDNLNGVYIPGDSSEVIDNKYYIGAVDKILQYS